MTGCGPGKESGVTANAVGPGPAVGNIEEIGQIEGTRSRACSSPKPSQDLRCAFSRCNATTSAPTWTDGAVASISTANGSNMSKMSCHVCTASYTTKRSFWVVLTTVDNGVWLCMIRFFKKE